jgi:hypothetical protein
LVIWKIPQIGPKYGFDRDFVEFSVTQKCDFKQDDALPEVNRSFGSRLLAEFVAELFQTVKNVWKL